MAHTDAQRDDLNELAMRRADVELKRRRERGRQSQARFRKRQAQVFQDTLEENERMKAAIAEIVEATKSGNRPGLLGAIRAAADIAGADASNLNVKSCGKRAAVANGSKIGVSGDKPGGSTEFEEGDSSSTVEIPGSRSRSPEDEASDGAWRPRSGNARSQSGRLSPRLDYGIWVDASRAVRVTKPPPEILPFIGAGRYTFAGHLYWACTDYLISLCRLVTMPYSLSLRFKNHTKLHLNPQQAEDRIWSVLRHSAPIPSVHLAQALAEAQCEFRDSGYMQGDSPACTEGIGASMKDEIEAKYVAHGHDLRAWMTLAELEEHVRRQLGTEAFSRLERAIANPPEAVNGGSAADLNVHAIVRLLIKNLAESYVCFGDGPRWRADSVSTLFSQTKTIDM
ncbi:hypothetical protein F5Y10DRAFT_202440 [Nemania abortiva]|nr:hypothetical protein F5Y10DRAFT_202440 [Nemania abortiva]